MDMMPNVLYDGMNLYQVG